MVLLRHAVSTNNILVYPSKIEAIIEWQRPKTTNKVKSFLGLIDYYRKFVERILQISPTTYKVNSQRCTFQMVICLRVEFPRIK